MVKTFSCLGGGGNGMPFFPCPKRMVLVCFTAVNPHLFFCSLKEGKKAPTGLNGWFSVSVLMRERGFGSPGTRLPEFSSLLFASFHTTTTCYVTAFVCLFCDEPGHFRGSLSLLRFHGYSVEDLFVIPHTHTHH